MLLFFFMGSGLLKHHTLMMKTL